MEAKTSHFATFDKSDLPYVKVSFRGVPSGESEFREYLTQMSALYGDGRKFFLLLDAQELGRVAMKYVLLQAKFMKENEHNTAQWTERSAVVVSGEKTRSLIDVLFSLSPPVRPVKLFEDRKDALAWLKSDVQEGAEAGPESMTSLLGKLGTLCKVFAK